MDQATVDDVREIASAVHRGRTANCTLFSRLQPLLHFRCIPMLQAATMHLIYSFLHLSQTAGT